MAEDLTLWLDGVPVAVVEAERRRLRLSYTDEARAAHPPGTPLLSLALPVSAQSYGTLATRTFLDGLLPEGEPRRAVAERLRLRADDTIGLIAALGRDCAGAVVIQPSAAPPPTQSGSHEPLDEAALARLLAGLRSAPLGAEGRVRVSLGGAQEKLVLARSQDGRWARPLDGAPSTHILKPEIRGLPGTVANEAFALRLALHLGVPAAPVQVIEVEGRPVLVVTRYDRRVDESGTVSRLHQEDVAQALGVPPERKYEADGGPRLRDVASLLAALEPADLVTLVRYLVVNVLVGNGDAHAKNYSLVHEPGGAVRLAPLYDVLSTLALDDRHLAMRVDGVERTDRVTRAHLLGEVVGWGVARRAAEETLDTLLERLAEASSRAREEVPGVPAEVLEVLDAQRSRLETA